MAGATAAALRYSLCGQGALVTGGTKGIGLAIAHELSALGATVVACARSPPEDGTLPAGMHVMQADVACREDRERLMEATESILRENGTPLSILINNAGTNIRKPTIAYSADDFERVMSTNFESAFHLSQLAHPILKASVAASPTASPGTGDARSASIVMVSSVSGGPSTTNTGTIYAATKAAMNQFTRNAACEWAPDNVRVNCVQPWYIATPLAEQVLQHEVYKQQVLHRTPMLRVGQVDEVSGVVAFLCSRAAGYVTGQCISIDGGFSVSGFGYFAGFEIPSPVPGK